jgi:hypothetical protein
VFAAKGRDWSGFVPGHTEVAVKALTGLSVTEAVGIADATEVERTGTGPEPQYEVWRERIRARLRARDGAAAR